MWLQIIELVSLYVWQTANSICLLSFIQFIELCTFHFVFFKWTNLKLFSLLFFENSLWRENSAYIYANKIPYHTNVKFFTKFRWIHYIFEVNSWHWIQKKKIQNHKFSQFISILYSHGVNFQFELINALKNFKIWKQQLVMFYCIVMFQHSKDKI